MNNEAILQRMAAMLSERLSAENPLREAIYITVAEPKEGEHTYAVLQTAKTQAREIVPGNFTWQYPCALTAFFFPPEGAFTAEQMRDWMEEAALSLVATLGAICGEGDGYYVLDATCTGPLQWEASGSTGYEGTLPFRLTVQF